jgi:hypothetical protein
MIYATHQWLAFSSPCRNFLPFWNGRLINVGNLRNIDGQINTVCLCEVCNKYDISSLSALSTMQLGRKTESITAQAYTLE